MKPDLSLFHAFDATERADLESAGRRHELAAGQVFLRVGSTNASLYIVSEGSVRVARPGPDGEIELARLGPGAVFGEMSFLDGSRTSAGVTAVGPTILIELGRDTLDRILDERPVLAGKLWKALALELKRRLARTNELVDHYVDLAQVLRDNPGYAEILGTI